MNWLITKEETFYYLSISELNDKRYEPLNVHAIVDE